MPRLTAFVLVLFAFAPGYAQELIAPPRPAPVVIVPAVAYPVPPSFYRPNPYDVWQRMAVDKQGYFKARVIFAPDPVYAGSGQPYPYLPVMPGVVQTGPPRR